MSENNLKEYSKTRFVLKKEDIKYLQNRKTEIRLSPTSTIPRIFVARFLGRDNGFISMLGYIVIDSSTKSPYYIDDHYGMIYLNEKEIEEMKLKRKNHKIIKKKTFN